jgi:DNA-binding MarR family transcriptional regulator
VEPSPERRYAEEVGVTLAGLGMTPAYGRLLGWLLICDPPSQSLSQLCDALGLSKGAVSTGIRVLERIGLVRRVAAPGVRGHVYEATPDGLIEMAARAGQQYAAVRELMERGLALLDDQESPRAARLRASRDFYAFIEREVPKLLNQYRQEFLAKEGEDDGSTGHQHRRTRQDLRPQPGTRGSRSGRGGR